MRKTGAVADVARELAARGIAHGAMWSDPAFAIAGEGQVDITGVPGWSCHVELNDRGYALLECHPPREPCPSTDTVVTVTTWALRIIGRDPGMAWQPGPPGSDLPDEVTPAAGPALQAAGVPVRLDVDTTDNFEVLWHVAAPDAVSRGELRIWCDGSLMWEAERQTPAAIAQVVACVVTPL